VRAAGAVCSRISPQPRDRDVMRTKYHEKLPTKSSPVLPTNYRDEGTLPPIYILYARRIYIYTCGVRLYTCTIYTIYIRCKGVYVYEDMRWVYIIIWPTLNRAAITRCTAFVGYLPTNYCNRALIDERTSYMATI